VPHGETVLPHRDRPSGQANRFHVIAGRAGRIGED
jgi:hypothetical protein